MSRRRRARGSSQLIEIPVTAAMSDNAVRAGRHPTAAQAAALNKVSWRARGIVASNGWKYVEYPQTGEAELYDLDSDPFELDNVVADPAYTNKVARMASRLHDWQAWSGKACR